MEQGPQHTAQQHASGSAAADAAAPPQPAGGVAVSVASGQEQQPKAAHAPWPATQPKSVRSAPDTCAADADVAGLEQEQEAEDAENRPEAAPYVHIPEEERRQLAEDFLQCVMSRSN